VTRPAVFLDRDGTINVERSYITRPEEIQLIPGADDAIAKLKNAGYAAVVVTNQAAIARGLLTETELDRIHQHLQQQLKASGAALDGIYHCPHHPDFPTNSTRLACDCRKPEPGLIFRAAQDLELDLKQSYMIGDSLTDLQAGWNAGCHAALVLTGHGKRTHSELGEDDLQRTYMIADSLEDVASRICG
jgi:D-glycero-D-manno-heptose 1,7-bisphosphate phosphatase